MAQGGGSALLVGFKVGATYGTTADVDATVGFGIRPLTWKVTPMSDVIRDMGYNGSRLNRESARRGLRRVMVEFSVPLKPQGLDPLFACLFGTAGTPSGAGPFVHTWKPAADMTGKFLSCAWYDGVTYQEIPSLRLDECEVKGDPGEDIICSFKAEGIKYTDPASVNTTLTALSEGTPIDIVQYADLSQLTYYVVPQGDAVAALEITNWTWKYANVFDKDPGLAFSSLSVPHMRQSRVGEYKCSGTLTEPYEATVRRTAALAGALYKMALIHTLSASKIIAFYVPSMTLTEAQADVKSRGGMPLVINWEAAKADAAPTGMNSLTEPHMLATNSRTTDALATS